MSEPLRKPRVNPDADSLHRLGREAERQHDFDSAYSYFDESKRVLINIPEYNQSFDVEVQEACIERDYGFTFVRQAIHRLGLSITDAKPESRSITEMLKEDLGNANEHLYRSRNITRSLIQELEFKKPHLRLVETKANIFAEHGATLGVLGRMATAKQVMFIAGYRSIDAGFPHNQDFSEAHDYLKQGDNGYYLVSNALSAARHEAIHGNNIASWKWLIRAGNGWFWTAHHDHSNIKAATLTVGNRILNPLIRSRAIESVYTKP